VTLLILVTLLASPLGSATPGPVGSTAGSHSELVSAHTPSSRSAAISPVRSIAPPGSGGPQELFFQNNSGVANASFNSTNQICYTFQGSCFSYYQEASSPNLLDLPGGNIGLTDQVILNTSQTICNWSENQSISHIAFMASTDGGLSWGLPTYLGDTNATCPYNQELEPSFTTNHSGAILGVYVGANTSLYNFGNVSTTYWGVAPDPVTGYINRSSDALVFVRSDDGGATFTNGTVLSVAGNANIARPAIAAIGQTIYVAYENIRNGTTPLPDSLPTALPVSSVFNGSIAYPISVDLIVSTNGGQTWSPPITLPGENATENYTAMSPSISVSSSGEVAVAYLTNRTCLANCTPGFSGYLGSHFFSTFGEDVVVATSGNNGTSWSLHTVFQGAGEPTQVWCVTSFWGNGCYRSSFVYNADPPGFPSGEPGLTALFQYAPPTAVAWNTTGDDLFVAWASASNQSTYAYQTNAAFSYEGLYEATSEDGGTSWTWQQLGKTLGEYHIGTNTNVGVFFPQEVNYPEDFYGLGLTVSNGTVYLSYQTDNESGEPAGTKQCGFLSFNGYDGSDTEWLTQSRGGVHWSSPIPAVIHSDPIEPNYFVAYLGYSSSVLVENGSPIIASSMPGACFGYYLQGGYVNCVYGGSIGFSSSQSTITANLDVATQSHPATLSVTVQELGLPSGTTWWATVSGNNFTQTTSSFTTLAPRSLAFLVDPVASVEVAGQNYIGVGGGQFNLSANGVVTLRYTTVVALNLSNQPSSEPYFGLNLYDPTWAVGYYSSETVFFPGDYFNLVIFVGCPMPWYLPTGYLLNVTHSDAVDANLTYSSAALPTHWVGSGAGSFTGVALNFSVVMNASINETMWTLPYGEYSVSVNAPDLPASSQFTFDWDGSAQASAPGGSTQFVGDVLTGAHVISNITASASPGWIYVGSAPSNGVVVVPQQTEVNLTFAHIDVGAPAGTVTFHAANLTNGTEWYLDFNGTSYSADTPWINVTTHPGSYPYSVGPATASNGSEGYVATGIPSTINVTTGTTVTVDYLPAVKVVVQASAGGIVTPSGVSWCLPGANFGPFAAAPANGYSFLGWSGTGTGSYTGPVQAINLTVGGPIVETANFAPLPADRFDLNFSEFGLPTGTPWEVTIGDTPYASSSPALVIPNLLEAPAQYTYSIPYLYGTDPNNATRYLASPGGGVVAAGTNIVNTISFQAEHYLSIASSPGGTVGSLVGSTLGGSTWFDSSLFIDAAPTGGYTFVGWVGTGPGSYTGSSASDRLDPSGSISEFAEFAAIVPPPPTTYTIEFELGAPLAPGTTWSLTLNGTSYVSSGAALNVSGLTGGVKVAQVATCFSPDHQVEYVPASGSLSFIVSSAANPVKVGFYPWYWVGVTIVGPGTASASSAYLRAGASVSIVATPDPEGNFTSWAGTGSGSYSGVSREANVTVNAPITEVATFVPVTAPRAVSTSAPFLTTSAGVAVIAVAGLVVGVLLGALWAQRRRRRPPVSPTDRGGGTSAAAPAPAPSSNDAPPATESSPARSRERPARADERWVRSNLRAGRRSAAIVVLTVLLLLGPLSGALLALGPMGGAPSTTHGNGAVGPKVVTPPAAPPSSGRGQFWQNAPLPSVAQNNVCLGVNENNYPYQTICGVTNITNEPSLNLSSQGVLVSAYTAYTNATPCASVYPWLSNFTYTQIGVSTSTNGGSTWSSPSYLGNHNCTTTSNPTVGSDPVAAAYDPITGYWFVANQGSGNVSVLNASSGATVGTIGVGSDPDAIADDAIDDDLFVANDGSANVSVVNPYCLCVVGSAPVGSQPDGLAFSPDDDAVFVANYGSDNLTAFSGGNWGSPSSFVSVPVGSEPMGIAWDPNLDEMFVANHGSANLTVVGAGNDTVVGAAGTGSAPDGVAATPTGTVYVANELDNNVTVVSDATDRTVANVPVGTQPTGVGYDAGSGRILVANARSNNVTEIAPSTHTTVGALGAGSTPVAVAFYSAYVTMILNSGSGNVSLISDASAFGFTNAWQPSVTSLANGTLVVAFVEFNLSLPSGCGSCYLPFPSISTSDTNAFFSDGHSDDYASSQLVVAFSYDGGARWTAPTPVNTSTYGGQPWCPVGCYTTANWIQQRPSLTAFGQTIYLAWTNISEGWQMGAPAYQAYCPFYQFVCTQGQAGVQLAVSVNGGPQFTAATPLPVFSTPGSAFSVAANPAALVTPAGTLVVAYASNLTANYSVPTDSGCPLDEIKVAGCSGVWSTDLIVAQSSDNGSTWTTGVAAAPVFDAQDYRSFMDGGTSTTPGDQLEPAPKITYDPASGQVVLAYVADHILNDYCLPSHLANETGFPCQSYATPDVWTVNGSIATNTWSSRLVNAWSGLGNATPGGLLGSYFYDPAVVSTPNGTIYLSAEFDNGSACTGLPLDSLLGAGVVSTAQIPWPQVFCGESLELFGTSSNNGTTFSLPSPIDYQGYWPSDVQNALAMPPGLQSSMIAAGNEVWTAWTEMSCPGWTGVNPTQCEMSYDYYDRPIPLWSGFSSSTSVVVSTLFQSPGVTVGLQETGLPAGTNWSVDFSGIARSGAAGATLSVSGVPSGSNQTWVASNVTVGPGIRYTGTPSIASPGNFTAATNIVWTYVEQYALTITTNPSYPNATSLQPTWFAPTQLAYCPDLGTASYFAFDPTTGQCYDATTINYNLTIGPGVTWENAGSTVPLQAVPLDASDFWCEFGEGVGANPGHGIPACVVNTFFTLGGYSNGVSGTGTYENYVNLTFDSWTGTGPGSYNGSANGTSITMQGPINETANFAFNAYCVWVEHFARGLWSWTSTCEPSTTSNSTIPLGFQEIGLPAGTAWGVSVIGNGANQTPFTSFSNSSVLLVADPELTPTSLAYFQAYSVPSSIPGEVWSPTTSPSSPFHAPLTEASATVTYTLEAESSTASPSQVLERGLPNGTVWSLSVDGVGHAIEGSAGNLTIAGGSSTVAGDPVYLSNGTGYVASSIDIDPYVMNGSWSNASANATTYDFEGPGVIWVSYSPVYELTAGASTGGSITHAGTSWIASGGTVTLDASAQPGYTFVGWTSQGVILSQPGALQITFSVQEPVSEYATFAPNATPTYVITVSASGLLSGGSYSVIFDGAIYTGIGTFALPAYGGGNYSILVPIAYDNGSALTRFLPVSFSTNLGPGPGGTYALSANGAEIAITFATQYALSVGSTGNGTTTPSSGQYWETAGNATTLTANPAEGSAFLAWAGSGASSVNATTSTIAVTTSGPSSEVAQFGPQSLVPATYTLAASESGLPSGVSWSLFLGGTQANSTTANLAIAGLNGTYTVSVPNVWVGSDLQYVSNVTNRSLSVTADVAISVSFTTELLVSVTAGVGGTATSTSEWATAGSSVTLTATAGVGYHFVGWEGTGPGNYTGSAASETLTITGAITESAEFAPNASSGPSPTSTSSALPGYVPWAALIGLLVVGLVLGYLLLGRSGGGANESSAQRQPTPTRSEPPDESGVEWARSHPEDDEESE
jgi:YVTN family beta-propeller protein